MEQTGHNDDHTIIAEWAGALRNVAIAAGPSNLLVVDEDQPGGLELYADTIGVTVPRTYTVRTGREGGGRHYYFQMPEERHGDSNGALNEFGCDVRGDGGYVVAAGSKHQSGQLYTVEVDTDPAPCPDWLHTAIRSPAPKSSPFTDPGAPFTLPEVITAGNLDGTLGRDDTLFKYACSLRGKGARVTDATDAMRDAWKRCEQPPGDTYPLEAALGKIDQAWGGYDYTGPVGDTAGPPAGQHAQSVAVEVEKLRVREAAKTILSAETAAATELPAPTRLDAFLAEPDAVVGYRIEGLMPAEARVLFAAPHKAGKTTFDANLIRALVDGDDFLDRFPVKRAARVVLIDTEMSKTMLRRWLRDIGIKHPERVEVISLRGRVATFDIIDDATRARWAKLIGAADVLILDCLRPVLDALGLSEDKDAGRFLVAFDALLAEARISEALVVHHTGHVGERARGDSRLQDWPDALWRLVRAEDTPTAARYLSVYGRDVELPETLLAYDPLTRYLSAVGGTRKDSKVDAALEDVIEHLAGQSGELSGRQIGDALADTGHGRDTIRAAISKGVADQEILTRDGPKRARLHFLNPSSARVRGCAR
jgi:hypothetical protein